MQLENEPKISSIASLMSYTIECTKDFWCENFDFNSIAPIKYGSAAIKAWPTIGLVYVWMSGEWVGLH